MNSTQRHSPVFSSAVRKSYPSTTLPLGFLFVSLPTVTGTLTDTTGHTLWVPWVQFSSSFPLQFTEAGEQNALVVLSLAWITHT